MNRFFEKRNLEIKRVPRDVQEKAEQIIKSIDAGSNPFTNYRAQRLMFNRNVISIFVKNKWRLVANDTSGKVQWVALLSHEKYSNFIKRM